MGFCHRRSQLPVAGTDDLSPGPRAICGFRDGSLSVVDAAFGERRTATVRGVFGEGGSGAIPWTSKAGHIETVFGCAHSPKDADTLATCSYGSNVKIWHVPTMDLKVKCSLVSITRRKCRPQRPVRALAFTWGRGLQSVRTSHTYSWGICTKYGRTVPCFLACDSSE